MAKSLAEYIALLDDRPGLVWPQPPAVRPLKATPSLAPLPGIRAVTFSLYGTLLRIDTGELHIVHPQSLRMQIALQKTIEEFKFWGSMTRKPGQPWEYFLRQYTELVENARLAATARKGDVPEIDVVDVWDKLIERLERNEYQWDRGLYGERRDLALKVAYFFHANLQGVAPASNALLLLDHLRAGGLRAGLICDAQPFSVAQMLRAFGSVRKLASLGDVLVPPLVVASFQVGARHPSGSLWRAAVQSVSEAGLEPSQVLHVSHRLEAELVPARQFGFRTALVASDENCTRVDKTTLRDPERKPDRLVTDLLQVRQLAGI